MEYMIFNELKSKIENLIYNANFSTISTDGRINSIIDEPQIIDFIIHNLSSDYKINYTEARSWYDMGIEYKGIFFPINIKITTGSTADNASSKAGMYYTLTGINPENPNMHSAGYEKFNKALAENFKLHTDTDYYFLVVFKNTGRILFTSLKRINKLTINARNLPYQIKWNDNLEDTIRTEEEQLLYIMNTFITAYKAQLKGVQYLDNWINNYAV